LIRKFHEAKAGHHEKVTIWGTGTPRREFLFADDLADACLFLMETYDEKEIINVGSGNDYTISELAEIIKGIIGYEGEIIYDHSKPDGTPRKLLDSSRVYNLGWKPVTELKHGIQQAYNDFLRNQKLLQIA